MTRAFLALGSNLGDREAFLREAVISIDEVDDLVTMSSVWETEPVGGPDNQGPYLNMVVELDTIRTPHALLALCHRLEQAAERVRVVRWGPRTLDVDVLWIEGVTVADDDLVVPHPRMFDRAFVLAPLEEIAPDVVPADWREAVDASGVWRRGPLERA
ncbi:MAG: 2-amino-4-hydroxy-6-hydroxymethyldihydropteridine diphosphokinase [Acidimicrobiia bacterium]